MPQHRCTIEFGPAIATAGQPAPDTVGDLHGWTETWYRSTDETSAQALIAIRNLANLRKVLLSAGWRVVGVKVSVFPLARTATRSSFTPQDGRGGSVPPAGQAGQGSEEAYDALTINLSSASGRSRVLSMRGLPSAVVSAGSQYLAPGFWTAPFGLWAAGLIGQFGIRVAEAPVKNAITTVYVSTQGAVLATRRTPAIVVGEGVNYAIGTPVRITGVLGMSGLNGVWTINSAATNIQVGGNDRKAYLLRQKRGREVLGTYTDGGEVWALEYTISNITAAAPGYGTSRRTGSFTTRPRGRRSTRR